MLCIIIIIIIITKGDECKHYNYTILLFLF